MTGSHDDDEDFELDLIRDPVVAPVTVPDTIRAMRARRVKVATPTDAPSVQEVLHNPAAAPDSPPPPVVRRFMRVQLRLAVSLMALFFGLIVVVNVAFHFSPTLAETPVAGVPLQWLFPVVVVIPLILVLGRYYLRRANANESSLTEALAQQEQS